ncbi:MAG: hypothetical protein AB8G23_24475 [Myxococcota bacterium]
MNQAWTRGLLFVALFLIWPLPLLGLGGSVIPAARFAQLGASLLTLIALEGSGGIIGLITGLMWAHAIVYGGLLWIAATLLSRFVFGRLSPVVRTRVVVVVIAFLAAWATLSRPYDTQFHHTEAHASLAELYQ